MRGHYDAIRAHAAERSGKRPERTIYEITDEGMSELRDWLTELVVEPRKEYLQFEAALSLLAHFPPDDAARLLACVPNVSTRSSRRTAPRSPPPSRSTSSRART